MSDTLKIAGMTAWGLVDMFWAFVYVVSVFAVSYTHLDVYKRQVRHSERRERNG